MVGLEGGQHLFGVVNKIEHVSGVFPGVGAVQAAQRLHRLDAGQALVHIHAAQQRLVKAGLELVGHRQDLILLALKGLADVATFELGVQRRAVLGEAIRARFLVVHLARKSHQRAHGVAEP